MVYRKSGGQLLSAPTGTRALIGVVVLTLLGAVAAQAMEAVVVVNPQTAVTSASRDELSKIFRKRLRTWANGQRAFPIDRVPGPLREAFSKEVHDSSVITIEVYWKRMIFSGRAVPPPEADDDEAVLDFVRSTPGAVGYVSPKADLQGVRRLRLEE